MRFPALLALFRTPEKDLPADQKHVLAVLCMHGDETIHLRDLAQIGGFDIGMLDRALIGLRTKGFVFYDRLQQIRATDAAADLIKDIGPEEPEEPKEPKKRGRPKKEAA